MLMKTPHSLINLKVSLCYSLFIFPSVRRLCSKIYIRCLGRYKRKTLFLITDTHKDVTFYYGGKIMCLLNLLIRCLKRIEKVSCIQKGKLNKE